MVCHPVFSALPKLSNTKPREIIRAKVPPALFFIFNVTFISFIQSILLFLLAAPTYIILLSSNFERDVTAADICFTVVQLSLISSEWFSDQQQWGTLFYQLQCRTLLKAP